MMREIFMTIDVRPASILLANTIDEINMLFKNDSMMTGLSTGFRDLDRMTTGLQRGELAIVAGVASSGKTNFILNIAEHGVINEKKPTLIFTAEMKGEQLISRMLSSLCLINNQMLKRGQLREADFR